jgi:hypothetical protein
VAGRIRSTEISNDITGNRTYNLPGCSIVPQPTTLPHALNKTYQKIVLENENILRKNIYLEVKLKYRAEKVYIK